MASPYTPTELATIRSLRAQNYTTKQIARAINRSPGGITDKLMRMGLTTEHKTYTTFRSVRLIPSLAEWLTAQAAAESVSVNRIINDILLKARLEPRVINGKRGSK